MTHMLDKESPVTMTTTNIAMLEAIVYHIPHKKKTKDEAGNAENGGCEVINTRHVDGKFYSSYSSLYLTLPLLLWQCYYGLS